MVEATGVVEVAEVAVGVVAGVEAAEAAAVGVVGVEAAAAVVAAVGAVAAAVVAVGVEPFRGEALVGVRGSSSYDSVRVRPLHLSNSVIDLLKRDVDILALDHDAILAAMYALTVSAEGDCYLCVPPDPGIESAALGASESALGAAETALFGTAPAEALHTFTLDSGRPTPLG
ncbi:unnamed protein product [Closterium sp. NIES-65]|nr:unnamed protein product [Closterium sp. NIES-65]